MDQQRFEYLLQRYKYDRLSPGEQEEWKKAIEDERFRPVVEADMENVLSASVLRHADWTDDVKEETLQNILTSRGEITRGAGGIYAMKWNYSVKWRPVLIGAAAACILFAGIWLLRRPSSDRSQPLAGAAVLPSSGDRAVLTLADGTRLFLDSSAGRPLASQGHTAIVKLPGSRVAYQSAGSSAPTDKLSYNQLETPRGARYELSLPDGTKVWLNAASSLRYPVEFTGTSREVELNGEAYFEVAANSNMPFRVTLKDWNLEVLGTAFDIKSYAGDPERYAALLQGSVKVHKAGSDLLLKPGQTAVTALGKEGWELRKQLPGQAISWKDNLFSFDKTPLPEVMQQLERWYDVKMECSPEAGTRTITGWISRQEAITGVLKMLEYTSGIQYSIRGRTILLDVRAESKPAL